MTDRRPMDRPRKRSGTPFGRELRRLLKAGALLVAIVLIVGSLPALFLWLWLEDPAEDAVAGLYSVEEVTIDAGDVDLAARLKVPTGEGPHPAIVFVHGSGRADRNGMDGMTEDFVINGYATLTYDKRGVGESGGNYSGVGPDNSVRVLGQLADDALAAVRHVGARPEIDAGSVGLLGVSQGGWIAPLAASRSDAVDFLVVLSGPAVTVGEEIYYSDLTGEREGVPLPRSAEEIAAMLGAYDGPHGYDPEAALAALDQPTLWILGREDRSIPVSETVARLRELQAAGKPYTVEVLPGVGHSLGGGGADGRSVFPLIFSWLARRAEASG